MDKNRMFAVALRNQGDLDVLGQGLARSFRVREVTGFEDLLAQLDQVEGAARSAASDEGQF